MVFGALAPETPPESTLGDENPLPTPTSDLCENARARLERPDMHKTLQNQADWSVVCDRRREAPVNPSTPPKLVGDARWLPIYDSRRTNCGARLQIQIPWSFRILGLEKGPSKRALQHAAFLARTPNPILKARRYEAATAGGTRSYREVALDFGVTREEVCQYLTLVKKLPAEFVASLANETRPDVLRRMSYRRLLAQARSGPIST
jgi:hypothetical protein